MSVTPVTRNQIITRGLSSRCPNCGASHALFKPGARFTINPECPSCGLTLDRGEGFFLGPFVINYTFTIAVFIVPVILLSIFGVIGTVTAIVLGALSALLIPLLLYRMSWSWWLMCYFYFQPEKLPNNGGALHDTED